MKIIFVPKLESFQFTNNIQDLKEHVFIKKIKDAFQIENCIQVVGDVTLWDKQKIPIIQERLFEILNDEKFSHVNYGYTGRKCKKTGKRYGVNTMTSLLADSCDSIGNKIIGNLVDFHTTHAIKNWGCTTSKECKNFVCVGPNCRFGDDIMISDLMCSEMICIEGGMQSFRQVVNMLLLERKVQCFIGARTKTEGERFFSCSRFLQNFQNKEELSAEEIQKEIENFMQNFVKYDKNKEDHKTKDPLFNDAIEKFIEYKLWKKLNLISFTKF